MQHCEWRSFLPSGGGLLKFCPVPPPTPVYAMRTQSGKAYGAAGAADATAGCGAQQVTEAPETSHSAIHHPAAAGRAAVDGIPTPPNQPASAAASPSVIGALARSPAKRTAVRHAAGLAAAPLRAHGGAPSPMLCDTAAALDQDCAKQQHAKPAARRQLLIPADGDAASAGADGVREPITPQESADHRGPHAAQQEGSYDDAASSPGGVSGGDGAVGAQKRDGSRAGSPDPAASGLSSVRRPGSSTSAGTTLQLGAAPSGELPADSGFGLAAQLQHLQALQQQQLAAYGQLAPGFDGQGAPAASAAQQQEVEELALRHGLNIIPAGVVGTFFPVVSETLGFDLFLVLLFLVAVAV
jgi:hypothetical protein